MMESASTQLRQLIARGPTLYVPGCYNAMSARVLESAGFDAIYMTGYGTSLSLIGLPDVGLTSMSEMVANARYIAQAVKIPLLADADTGFGNAVNVIRTVREYIAAGVAGIHMEDQVSPKRCGHMQGKELITPKEMAKKVEAAVKARKDPDFIINARTDAIAVEGLDQAIARAKLYLAAGADMVFTDAVHSEEQIVRFVDAVQAPVSINIGFGIRSRPTTPLMPVKRLAELGVARVTMARMLPSAAVMGMHKALELMRDHVETGTVHDRPYLLYGMDEITELMGYPKIAELEQQFLPDDQLERKYGSEKPDYVVRNRKY